MQEENSEVGQHEPWCADTECFRPGFNLDLPSSFTLLFSVFSLFILGLVISYTHEASPQI